MSRTFTILLWGVLLAVGNLSAQEPDAYKIAVESINKDLEAELQKLAALRKKIASEKPELARRAGESALNLRQKKRQYEIAKATQASVDHDLEKRDSQLKLWRDERIYLDGMLAEFRKNYRGFIPLPELEAMEEVFRLAEKGGDEGSAASFDLVEQMTRAVGEAGKIGVVKGSALGEDGIMIDGKFAVAGPVSWFAADDGSVSGMVRDSKSLQAAVVDGTSDFDAISALLEGTDTKMVFDPTLGNAVAMEEVEGDLFSYIKKGGIWVYPIMAMALIAFLAAVMKWVQLLNVRPVRASQIQSVIDAVNDKNTVGANLAAAKIKHPAGALLERGVEVAEQPVDQVEESIYEKFLEAQPGLQRWLPLIAIASATSPLLGLLGTVTGMIKTFNQITIFGTGDARSLSGGISEALITTAFGLIVAIPALILHALLSRKVQGIRSTMEMASLAFINGLKKNNG